MRKAVLTGVGSLLLFGLVVTQSWAGSFKSDLVCAVSIPPPPVILHVKKAKVSITPHGDVKGSIKLFEPLSGAVSLSCEIFCGTTSSAGPVPCAEGETGDNSLKIKAPGLGAALVGICLQPSVAVGPCISTYFPPGP